MFKLARLGIIGSIANEIDKNPTDYCLKALRLNKYDHTALEKATQGYRKVGNYEHSIEYEYALFKDDKNCQNIVMVLLTRIRSLGTCMGNIDNTKIVG